MRSIFMDVGVPIPTLLLPFEGFLDLMGIMYDNLG